MGPRGLLAVTLVVTAVAACAANTDTLSDGSDGAGNGNSSTASGSKKKPGVSPGADQTDDSTKPAAATGAGTPSGPVATNSPAGKTFYKANVHPFMAATCGGCHDAAGPGPNWLTAADPEKSYAQLFSQGYVVPQARITAKPAHGGLTTNVLSAVQISTYEQWVGMEVKDGGTKAPPNVLAKLGTCFDRAKFDAMKMADWRTTQRTNNNNTNQVKPWNENADNCTGCDNAPCTTCHSADPATNFNNAVGNPILPAETTFENTKLTNPAYITKFFGVSPDGKAIASDGIKKKSTATKLDKAYSHPMFALNTAQQTALDAFVADTVAKFAAGTCGK